MDYRLLDLFTKNKFSEIERSLIKDFIKLYSKSEWSTQVRLNEILGKELKSTQGWKKSKSNLYPKWFPKQEIDLAIADHCVRYTIDGVDTMVCHPYGMSISSFENLLTFCKKNKLHCVISGESDYFLGATMRLMFTVDNPSTKTP